MGMNANLYEQWEVKFRGYMRLQKLKDTILPPETLPDVGKNEEAFAEWIQFLDDRSLSLVKDARPVGLPAMGNERHGVQRSTPVSEGCDHHHPRLQPCSALDLHYAI